MTVNQVRCLVLACGNSLRSDDGAGPWLAAWAQEHFRSHSDIRIISRHQWTPELVDDIAEAESVIFIDASAQASPGEVQLHRVTPTPELAGLATHHLHAAQLLDLSSQLYGSMPRTSLLLTIGIGCTDFGETFSQPVQDSLLKACVLLEELVLHPDAATLS